MKRHLLRLLSAVLTAVLPVMASAESIRLYLLKSTAYADTYVYSWDAGGEITAKWPGVKMDTETIDDAEYFVWEAPEGKAAVNAVFNNGNKGLQTNDIKDIKATTYYKIKNNTSSKTDVTTFNPFVLADPVISREGNTVTIKASGDGGTVYYTTDGSDPTNESTVYEEPFTLAEDAVVKAVQMKTVAKSEVVTFEFNWELYAETVVAAGIYAAAEEGTVPQICSTDLPYVPVDGQPKVNGQPDILYLMGSLVDHNWETNYGIEGKRYGGVFVFENVELKDSKNAGADCLFNFAVKLSKNLNDWNTVNGGDRYGANAGSDIAITLDNATAYRKTTPTGNNDYHSAATKSWKVKPGTYLIMVDFASGKVTVTEKAPAAFVEMAAADVESLNMSADSKTIYAAEVTGSNNAVMAGETVAVASGLDAATAYIAYEGKIEAIKPVCVDAVKAEDLILTPDTYLMASVGTEAARCEEVSGTAVGFVDGKAALDYDSFESNSVVVFDWEADNAQGLTFSGTISLLKSDESVRVYAGIPDGWSGIAYTIVSKLDAESTVEGTFEELDANGFLVIEVPAKYIYSTIEFRNNVPAEPLGRAAVDADRTFTYELYGKSMYFDNNGEHWGEQDYGTTTGIYDVRNEDAVEARYYNLQGMKVNSPAQGGIYIRRSGNEVKKIVM